MFPIHRLTPVIDAVLYYPANRHNKVCKRDTSTSILAKYSHD